MTHRRGLITIQFLRSVPVADQDKILKNEYGIPVIFRNEELGIVLLLIPSGHEEEFIQKFCARDDIESASTVHEE